ncbi:MAG: hypothetical protein RJB62_540 [Pseudomonadota bacterium]
MLSILLETERLLLRPPLAADIGRLVALLNDFDVSKNLAVVPFPYTQDDGCAFVVKAARERLRGEAFVFAMVAKADAGFLGICSVHPAKDFMLGYWLGKPHWGRGYATEAAARVAGFAFAELKAERLTATWHHDNPASGRVLEKLGCRPDGGENSASLSRGTEVFCHKVLLTRADFERGE